MLFIDYMKKEGLVLEKVSQDIKLSISLISKLNHGRCSYGITLKYQELFSIFYNTKIEFPLSRLDMLEEENKKLLTLIHEKELKIIDLEQELMTIYKLLDRFSYQVSISQKMISYYKNDIKALNKALNDKKIIK